MPDRPRSGMSCSSVMPTPATCILFAVTLAVGLAADRPIAAQSRADAHAHQMLQRHRDKHAELQREYHAALKSLGDYCDQKQFLDGAELIRKLAEGIADGQLVAYQLPRAVQSDVPPGLPEDQRYWRVQLRHVRSEYAGNLYRLSKSALRAGFPSYAYSLIQEVAFHDPDHEPARELLGYVRFGNEWVTPFEKMQATATPPRVWHDQFGWIPETHVERYEQGERWFQNRWISADQESEIRKDFRHAWEIRTEHFLIKTNHSLEEGVAIASRLEEFRRFFHQTFAGFFHTPEQIERMFSGTARSRPITRPHLVHYYRTQQEYVARLRNEIPQIAMTNGLYYMPDRTTYFFHNPESEGGLDTLYHEATHQFFFENTSRDRRIAEDGHFWIVEGIACYMESFRSRDGLIEVGDPHHIRFQAARYRLLHDRYYVRLKDFVRLGREEFQTHPSIKTIYSQASGMAHFFMHYDGGSYRDALIAHLQQLYRPRPPAVIADLSSLTGVAYDQLDREYILYIKDMHEQFDQPFGD